MNFSAIPPDAVIDLWPTISPGLEDLLEHHTLGRWTAQDVLVNLQAGQWQLYVVSDEAKIIACLVCSIMDGHVKTFEIGMCWGTDANDWSSEVNQVFDQIAAELGCEQLTLDGRPGWRKIMRECGYKVNSVRYMRQVNG